MFKDFVNHSWEGTVSWVMDLKKKKDLWLATEIFESHFGFFAQVCPGVRLDWTWSFAVPLPQKTGLWNYPATLLGRAAGPSYSELSLRYILAAWNSQPLPH